MTQETGLRLDRFLPEVKDARLKEALASINRGADVGFDNAITHFS